MKKLLFTLTLVSLFNLNAEAPANQPTTNESTDESNTEANPLHITVNLNGQDSHGQTVTVNFTNTGTE